MKFTELFNVAVVSVKEEESMTHHVTAALFRACCLLGRFTPRHLPTILQRPGTIEKFPKRVWFSLTCLVR